VRALVVGAGAVGQVLALHLVRAGANVTFGVRRPESVRETTMLRLRQLGGPEREVLPALQAVSSLEGVPAFDLVFLTVPSDALESPFLRSLAKGFGDATVIGLQPGLDDRQRLVALGVRDAQLVRGLISLVSFHSPLSPTDALQEEGTAYWFPPLSPWAFDGPAERVDAVVSALRQGGMPAAKKRGLEDELVFFTAALLVTVRSLEQKGWSLAALAAAPSASTKATAQALAVVERRLSQKRPLGPSLVASSWLVSLGARMAPWVVPFDLEAYLRVHFTKVAPQTRLLLGDLVREGGTLGLQVEALAALLA
jgi:2-dehydropantoate 2-reductase